VTETIVTVLNFEHRERADILVRTALFFILTIPFLSDFVSIVSVTRVYISFLSSLKVLGQGYTSIDGRYEACCIVALQDAADDGSGKNPLQSLVDAIGEGLKAFGQTVSHGCAAVGEFMITLGFHIHSLL
jgi:hypothetical protein